MSRWPQVRLSEICSEGGGWIRTGPFGSQLHQRDYVDDVDGVPVIMPKDMERGRFSRTSTARIDQRTANRLSQHLVTAGDIVLSRRGDVGRSAWIGPDDLPALCGTGSIRVHPGVPSSVLPEYLRYFFRSHLAIDYLEAHAVGATMPNLNADIVAAMPVPVPPRNLQAFAAQVLTTLDGLIGNNRLRVELLEQMAEAIYREWFVRFRYPGHEDAIFVDSPLGLVPADWKLTTCGHALEVLGGGTPSKSEPLYWDGGSIPWFTPSDLTRHHTRFAESPSSSITPEGLAKSSARLFPAGSILMTSRATLGVLAIATEPSTCNQGFIVVLPDQRWPSSFIYEWLSHNAANLEMLGTGATFKEITKGAFKRFPFLVPDQDCLDAFREIATPLDEQVLSLQRQTRATEQLRDMLLPRLVSGKIDVSHLDLDELVGSVA